jgi:hypothetical protein
MTNKILNIIAKHPSPDQNLFPNVWLTWTTAKDGRVYLNCKTNIKHNRPEPWMQGRNFYLNYQNRNDSNICVYDGANLTYAYCKYHSRAKLLEFSVVNMNTRRTSGARKWEFAKGAQRYFLDINKRVYNSDGEQMFGSARFHAYEYHSIDGFANYLNVITKCYTAPAFITEFKKFIESDIYIGSNGRVCNLMYAYQIPYWYSMTNVTKTTGKTQTLLDELTSLPHKDLTDICREYGVENMTSQSGWYSRELSDVIYFESLNDTWSVLRYCYRISNDDNKESYRVYISEDGDCKMTKLNANNEWIPAQNRTASWQSSYGRIVNFDDMAKSKRLSYIMPILRDLHQHRMLTELILIVKNPQIEKLFKMGYTDFAKSILKDGYAKANLKKHFGEPNKKATNVFTEWGINKHQLDIYTTKLEQKYGVGQLSGWYYDNSIVMLKQIFGKDLSHIDNDTFSRLIDFVAQLRYTSCHRLEYFNTLNIDLKHFFNHTARLFTKPSTPSNCPQVLADTIKQYRNLPTDRRPEINWIFDSYSDIVRAHDALMAIQQEINAEHDAMRNMEKAARMKLEDERRQKLDKKRKEWEYEDDNYIIRLPKDCAEILNEGSKQRICIAGYASSHANGNTNLFFLRKKSEPDVPFYAIEMNNDMRVRQIHGFGNSWLGNHPEAIPTVVRWMRKSNISCSNEILTCTSKGYGSNRQYVEMPVVD